MQNGPRYLTELDINQAYVVTNLTAGGGVGQTGTGLTIDQLGQVGQTGDGRFYRLISVGGTSTVAPGTLLVSPVASSDYAGLAIPTAQAENTAYGNPDNTAHAALSKGSIAFNVTNGGTGAITIDQFAGGYVEVLQTSGTNEGPVAYRIEGNTADASSGHNGTVTISLSEPLDQPEALVAGTDTVNLIPSPYSGCEASATLGNPVGVVTVQVPNTASATYAAWVQTKGHCLCTADATGVTIGEAVAQSTTTAGDVTVAGATSNQIGVATKTGTSGVVGVNLTL